MSLQRRIDYTPDAHAATVIDSLRTGYSGGDASSAINRVIAEWAAHRPDPAGSSTAGSQSKAPRSGSWEAWGEAARAGMNRNPEP